MDKIRIPAIYSTPNITPIVVFNALPIQVKTVINSVKNINFQITDFHTYLSGLYTPTTNKLNSFLTSLNNFPVLKRMFYEDFHKVKNLAIWDKLNDTATLNRWKQLAELNITERVNLNIITSATKTQSIKRYYDTPLKDVLKAMSFEKRWRFLDEMGDISPPNLQKFIDDPSLINKWFRFYDDAVLKGYFSILSKTIQIEFAEYFGVISTYWFNRFKKQSYLFDNFNTASSNSKQLAMQNPKLWIIINKPYVRPSQLGEKLSSTFINNKYNTTHAGALVNAVENRVQELYALGKSRNYMANNYQLVSGMVDKSNGQMSKLFTNFADSELKPGGLYSKFLETNTDEVLNMHPNLRSIVNDLQGNQGLYNMDSPANLVYTGPNIAAHAEIRALDNLIKKKFGYILVDEDNLYKWMENDVLGYNRNVVVKIDNNNVIMHTCADCFYIKDMVTFIDNF